MWGPAIQNVPTRAVSNGPNTFFILFPEGGKTKYIAQNSDIFKSKDVPAGCQRSGLEQRKVRLLLLSAVRETPAERGTSGNQLLVMSQRARTVYHFVNAPFQTLPHSRAHFVLVSSGTRRGLNKAGDLAGLLNPA